MDKKLNLPGLVNRGLKFSGVVFILLILFAYSEKEVINRYYTEFFPLPQKIQFVPIGKDYALAGERIPMDNFDTRERLDRELIVNAYRHSSTIQYIKLSKRYFPVIEPILKKNNIPDDFKYLAVAESGLRNVNSPAGAKGIWQFMKPISRDLGLEIYDEVDERYHIEKSTQAACDYLNKLHDRFGSWTNAAAAYNTGPTNFSKYLRQQDQSNYYDLNISEETMRYIFRIVAIKTILESPKDYGFNIPEEEKYAPLSNYYTMRIESTIPNLGTFANERGTTYRMLKIYNPWLRETELTIKNNIYFLNIPKT